MQILQMGVLTMGNRARSGGALAPSILFEATNSLTDESVAGASAGTISVRGVTGTPTYAIDSDPSGYFVIDGDQLELSGTPIAGDYPVTISVSGVTPSLPPRTFTIHVAEAEPPIEDDADQTWQHFFF